MAQQIARGRERETGTGIGIGIAFIAYCLSVNRSIHCVSTHQQDKTPASHQACACSQNSLTRYTAMTHSSALGEGTGGKRISKRRWSVLCAGRQAVLCVCSLSCGDARVKASLLLTAHSNRDTFKAASVHSTGHTDNIQTSIHSMGRARRCGARETYQARHSARLCASVIPPSTQLSR